jgi:hypothetical protein
MVITVAGVGNGWRILVSGRPMIAGHGATDWKARSAPQLRLGIARRVALDTHGARNVEDMHAS